MRFGPPDHVLASSAEWIPRVSSWQGTELRAADIPVAGGSLRVSRDQQVPEILNLQVPETADGFNWVPLTSTEHPLARYGQQLSVEIHVSDGYTQDPWVTRLGSFPIQDWSNDDEGIVAVTGFGVLQLAADDRLPEATSPEPDGTLASEFRRLMPAGVPVDIDDSLVDRAAPRSFVWDEDRLAALYEITDSWPARILADDEGGVRVLPVIGQAAQPVRVFSDGDAGILVKAPRGDTRNQAYNAVVARGTGQDPDAPPIQAEAQVTSGPMSVNGPYGVVRRFYASPLITTNGQALAAARSILSASVIPSRTITVHCAPDPRIELDDPVGVVRHAGTSQQRIYYGYVHAYDLPLTVDGGLMTITVGIGGEW